jgi:uncharacterized protein YdhG (YjbR/CyaY superfamily)
MADPSYTTVDEYIAQFDAEVRSVLERVRETIRSAAPGAEERISYRMPCFWQGGPLIYFAAMKRHLGVYPTSEGMAYFADKLADYKTSKGAVQFPWDKAIPYELIAEMAAFRAHAG